MNSLEDCICCNRTPLSVCRNRALEENWEVMKRITRPLSMEEPTWKCVPAYWQGLEAEIKDLKSRLNHEVEMNLNLYKRICELKETLKALSALKHSLAGAMAKEALERDLHEEKKKYPPLL